MLKTSCRDTTLWHAFFMHPGQFQYHNAKRNFDRNSVTEIYCMMTNNFDSHGGPVSLLHLYNWIFNACKCTQIRWCLNRRLERDTSHCNTSWPVHMPSWHGALDLILRVLSCKRSKSFTCSVKGLMPYIRKTNHSLSLFITKSKLIKNNLCTRTQ